MLKVERFIIIIAKHVVYAERLFLALNEEVKRK